MATKKQFVILVPELKIWKKKFDLYIHLTRPDINSLAP